MFTLLIATKNLHKLEEISALLKDRPVHLKSLADFQKIPVIVEDGATFQENAAIKANICFEYFNLPVMGDDSGLEVPALNNTPGVYSARYSGANADDLKNNLFLLEQMKGLEGEARKARFVCTVCYRDQKHLKFFTGITEGYIIKDFKGSSGFGYDPIFYIPEINKTYAELSMEEKNALSHRGKAMRKFMKFLDNLLNSGSSMLT